MSNSAPPGGFGSPPPLPGYGTGGQTGPPRNYLVQAILTTLFCCLPFGIVSIVFAAQVNSKFNAGDVTGAVDASRKAKLWAWLSFGFGLAIILIAVASGRGIES
jgi:Interferon-induced transmembrane protein